ncbi:unnamed protein product [Cylicocyclus nassatus]|uniref:Cyclin-dependent kinase inhibitor domain-containing protein n=1 Tax=Cylicocyclus nassatus TaxID=53992 RepID=A0AA36HBA2_CYLNA|nr:unnamed protein product [Cylicocyclus nassatus]
MENNSPGRNRRVKRCLFGKPDQQEVEKWLDETSKKQLKRSKDKWSYDFELDVPVKGDIEYEPVSIDQVPSIYKPHKIGKRRRREVSEFNPNIPSASSEEGTSEEGSDKSHRPFTRSCTKQSDNNSLQNRKSLKQAKLTNYLKVRKRRSADSRGSKDAVTPIKNMKSAAPSSPFRFVEPNAESEGVMDDDSPRSSSASPPKSPRKRAAPRAVHPLHTNLLDSYHYCEQLSFEVLSFARSAIPYYVRHGFMMRSRYNGT